MKLRLRHLSWLLPGSLTACIGGAVRPGPVHVEGESRDIRRLAGTWRGEFQRPERESGHDLL